MLKKIISITQDIKVSFRHYLRVGSLIIIILVLIGGVIYPNYLRIREVRTQTGEIKDEEEILQAKLDVILQAQSDYPYYKELLGLTQKHLPDDPQVLSFMSQTVKLAENESLSLEDFHFSAASTGSRVKKGESDLLAEAGLQKFGFTLTGTGSYPQIKAFSSVLERGDREIRITNLRIYQSDKTEGSEILNFNFNGEVFWK